MILRALANAFKYLIPKLNNKKLVFVGYGFLGLARAITNFRATLNYENVLVIQKEINISFNVDFKDAMTKDMKFIPGVLHK
jgi:NAD(P)H-dependent FMN reductase